MPLEKVGYTKEGVPSAYFNDNKAMSLFLKAMKDITQCFYLGMHDYHIIPNIEIGSEIPTNLLGCAATMISI